MLQYLLYRHLIGFVPLFIATVIVFALAGEALSGASLNSGVSVGDVVFERLPNTLKLLPLTIFFAAVISIPLGILAAVCRGTLVDRAVGILAVLGVATPNFWLGLILIYLFYVLLDWLPPLAPEFPSSYILSCFVLGTFAGAGMTQVIRSGIVEVLQREEQPGWRVFWNPCFRLLAAAPILFGGFLAGAVVVETTFRWPGIGYLALRAMFQADMPVLLVLQPQIILGRMELLQEVGEVRWWQRTETKCWKWPGGPGALRECMGV